MLLAHDMAIFSGYLFERLDSMFVYGFHVDISYIMGVGQGLKAGVLGDKSVSVGGGHNYMCYVDSRNITVGLLDIGT